MSKKQDTLVAPLYCRDNDIEDFDSIGSPGYFSGLKSAPNAPSSQKPWIVAINIPSNNNWKYGNLIATNGSQLFTRPNSGDKTWGDWVEYATKSDFDISTNIWGEASVPFTKLNGNSKIVTVKQVISGKVVQLFINVTATGSTSEGSDIIKGKFSNLIKYPTAIILSPTYQTVDEYTCKLLPDGTFIVRVSKGSFSNGTLDVGFCYLFV